MNAIFHNDQEIAIEQTIREMAEHINWLKQQTNANEATVQQRGRWLQAIIKYRASAQATIEEYAAQPAPAPVILRENNTYSSSLKGERFWNYEGFREFTIQQAHRYFPDLY